MQRRATDMFGPVPIMSFHEPALGGGYYAGLLANAHLQVQQHPPVKVSLSKAQGHVPNDAALLDK
jgi:hypothetical protein